MSDNIRTILKRKKSNINFVKDNYRWWFACKPYTVDEFDSMLEQGVLEIVSRCVNESIDRNCIYKNFSEPVIECYNAETKEKIVARYSWLHILNRQWLQAKHEIMLDDGSAYFADGKWNIIGYEDKFKEYIEYDDGDLLHNRLELIEKYMNEVYGILENITMEKHKRYYHQRLELSEMKMDILEKNFGKIKMELEKKLKTLEVQEILE